MTRASRTVPLVLALALMTLGAGSARALDRALSMLPQQTSDAVIAHDLGLMDAWQARLDSLPGAPKDPWRAAAASAWLETARAEYLDNDRTGYPQAAFTRAVELIEAIQGGAEPIAHQTVPPAEPLKGSLRVADSLYVVLDKLEHDPGFLCAADEIAHLEVQLAWAGNEQVDQGTCNSSPHLARAGELAEIAARKIQACQEVKPIAAPAPPPKPAPVPVPAVIIPTAEELQITRNVHFALGRSDISEVSRHVIAGIAGVLTKYPSVTVRLEGHTDSRGSAAYNMELSRQRVTAVYDVFIGMGIDSTRMTITYKGKSELYATEDSKRGYALNRRVEMVFVDSEGRDIKTSRQEGDIQLESDRPKPAPKPAVKKRATTGTGTSTKPKPAPPAAGAASKPPEPAETAPGH